MKKRKKSDTLKLIEVLVGIITFISFVLSFILSIKDDKIRNFFLRILIFIFRVVCLFLMIGAGMYIVFLLYQLFIVIFYN